MVTTPIKTARSDAIENDTVVLQTLPPPPPPQPLRHLFLHSTKFIYSYLFHLTRE